MYVFSVISVGKAAMKNVPARIKPSQLLLNCIKARKKIVGSLMIGGAGLLYSLNYTLSDASHGVRAYCNSSKQQDRVTAGNPETKEEPDFPWREFFKLLIPDIFYLLGAILVCNGFFIQL